MCANMDEHKPIELEKDDRQHPVPLNWRPTFHLISEAFRQGDFRLRDHAIPNVAPIDGMVAQSIAENISDYGDALASLDPATWDRSIFLWMGGYWQVLVDLTTTREQVSDLTLHARLYDVSPPRLEIQSVHVP